MFGGLEAWRGSCLQSGPPYQALVGIHDGDKASFDANSERASAVLPPQNLRRLYKDKSLLQIVRCDQRDRPLNNSKL